MLRLSLIFNLRASATPLPITISPSFGKAPLRKLRDRSSSCGIPRRTANLPLMYILLMTLGTALITPSIFLISSTISIGITPFLPYMSIVT